MLRIIFRNVSIHLMLLFIVNEDGTFVCEWAFQYISCYSLSILPLLLETVEISFNTSHVTLYQEIPQESVPCRVFQYISCYSLSDSCKRSIKGILVSIHLMLLFIARRRNNHAISGSFQYISCYSLSPHLRRQSIHPFVSIHLMLLFIKHPVCCKQIETRVSIHLMLLFIFLKKN